MDTTHPKTKSSWMQITLKLAAIYNVLWGSWVVLFPAQFFILLNLNLPDDLSIWQGMGMVIGVYGLGYFWAGYDPLRHWPIIAVGLLGKIFGPIGYLWNLWQGKIEPNFGYIHITNDVIWILPFSIMLYKVHFTTKWKLSD